jgi:hypothetical protein
MSMLPATRVMPAGDSEVSWSWLGCGSMRGDNQDGLNVNLDG